MKRLITLLFLSVFIGGMVFSCKFKDNSDRVSEDAQDKILTGRLKVAVDESVLDMIQEQKESFEHSYPHTNLELLGSSEVGSINALLKGEADLAILTRTLKESEDEYFANRSIRPRIFPIATDGIVLLVNSEKKDTSITIEQIRGLMEGKENHSFSQMLFSDVNSSIFRELKEASGAESASSAFVREFKGGERILEGLVEEEDAVGVMSFTEYVEAKKTWSEINKIRILSVQNSIGENADGKFYLPSQSNFGLGVYPLTRSVYVLNYQPNMGLGIGWSAFLTGDRGQRIILKYGLLPATMPGREIIIRDRVN